MGSRLNIIVHQSNNASTSRASAAAPPTSRPSLWEVLDKAVNVGAVAVFAVGAFYLTMLSIIALVLIVIVRSGLGRSR